MSQLPGKLHTQRRSVWAVTVFMLLCFYMLLPTRNDFFEAARYSYYVCAVPVLMAAVLYFRRLRDGVECKFLLAFWIWFWFTRALNGSPLLDHDFRFFFDLALILPFFAFGAALTRAERIRFLDWLSAVIGGFYFVLGLIALIAFLHRSMYRIPVLGEIGIIREASYARISFFDTHPNTSAYWYLIALFLMIYQFFHCKQKLWRIPIFLSASLDLIVIAITYSRSVRVCMGITFSLVSVMLLLRLFRSKPRFLRAMVILPVSFLVLVAFYEGSGLCADMMATLSYEITDMRPLSESGEQTITEAVAQTKGSVSVRPMLLPSGEKESLEAVSLRGGLVQSDPRPKSGNLNDLSSNRIEIWRAAFQAIAVKPSVLWKGQFCNDVMTITHSIMGPDVPGGPPVHFHNAPLQILMTTGLLGLVLTLFFFVRVFYRGARLFLCVSAPLSVLTLVIPVLASMPYYMLEACSFMDIRILFLFLMCGFVVGYAGEYNGA